MNKNINIDTKIETMREDSFMKKLLKKRLNQKGLTLIELLAVIVILAIVAAIAVPAIGNIIENSRIKAAKSDAVMILNAVNLYETNEGALASGATIAIQQDANSTGTPEFDEYLDSIGNFNGPVTITQSAGGNTITGEWENGLVIDFAGTSLSDINTDTTTADTGMTINP